MYLNLSAYRFVDLQALPAMRARIDECGRRHGLVGTVLLAPEGINLYVSAPPEGARAWLAELAAEPAFTGLDARQTWSPEPGYQRWKVRIRREIITFRQLGVAPRAGRAPTVSPQVLRRWLDQRHDDDGRPLAMVDTRNRVEVDAGTFEGAIDLRLPSFTALPQALSEVRERLAGHRVVTFCTGGIRCEKAALWMAGEGMDHVVQLEGGVLRYFEEVGGTHWRGNLFVFDRRAAVTPALAPAPRGEATA